MNVTTVKQLSFGSMVVEASGPVTLSSRGGALSGPVMVPAFLKGGTTPGTFVVKCTLFGLVSINLGGFYYKVGLANDSILLNKTNAPPSAAMTLSKFTISPQPTTPRGYYVRKCSGYEKTFTVGATLAVDASQTPGTYKSTIRFVVSP